MERDELSLEGVHEEVYNERGVATMKNWMFNRVQSRTSRLVRPVGCSGDAIYLPT